MNAQQDPHQRGPAPPPVELEGMEVRDASGGRARRVEDVYVDREGSATHYVALACEGPQPLPPRGAGRRPRRVLVIGVEHEHLSDAPTVPRDAAATRAHEGDVAGYFRNLHAGYMRPWAERPQLHGAGYMRPGEEPPEVHGAGRMDPRFLSAVKR